MYHQQTPEAVAFYGDSLETATRTIGWDAQTRILANDARFAAPAAGVDAATAAAMTTHFANMEKSLSELNVTSTEIAGNTSSTAVNTANTVTQLELTNNNLQLLTEAITNPRTSANPELNDADKAGGVLGAVSKVTGFIAGALAITGIGAPVAAGFAAVSAAAGAGAAISSSVATKQHGRSDAEATTAFFSGVADTALNVAPYAAGRAIAGASMAGRAAAGAGAARASTGTSGTGSAIATGVRTPTAAAAVTPGKAPPSTPASRPPVGGSPNVSRTTVEDTGMNQYRTPPAATSGVNPMFKGGSRGQPSGGSPNVSPTTVLNPQYQGDVGAGTGLLTAEQYAFNGAHVGARGSTFPNLPRSRVDSIATSVSGGSNSSFATVRSGYSYNTIPVTPRASRPVMGSITRATTGAGPGGRRTPAEANRADVHRGNIVGGGGASPPQTRAQRAAAAKAAARLDALAAEPNPFNF